MDFCCGPICFNCYDALVCVFSSSDTGQMQFTVEMEGFGGYRLGEGRGFISFVVKKSRLSSERGERKDRYLAQQVGRAAPARPTGVRAGGPRFQDAKPKKLFRRSVLILRFSASLNNSIASSFAFASFFNES